MKIDTKIDFLKVILIYCVKIEIKQLILFIEFQCGRRISYGISDGIPMFLHAKPKIFWKLYLLAGTMYPI